MKSVPIIYYAFFGLFCSEDQQFLHEVVSSVLNGNGVGMFKKKRLRDLMTKETCRQKVVKKFLLEISDDKKSDVVSDVVCRSPRVIKMLY